MRRLALVCCLLCVPVLALPAAALASTPKAERAVLKKLNAERKRHGLRPVRLASRLTLSCRAYARRMLAENRWAHAESKRVRGFRRIVEILARTYGRMSASAIVRMWMESSVHRNAVLGRHRYVGIAARKGRMGGKETTVWVVRFAR
jgi:uncharacterized protein YkwD